MPAQQRAFGTSGIVLREVRNLLEETGAQIVIEYPGFERARPRAEAVQHLADQLGTCVDERLAAEVE
jgi:endonuclease IV